MGMNKAMIAAGLVCVVAPAAAMLRADGVQGTSLSEGSKSLLSEVLLAANLLDSSESVTAEPSPVQGAGIALPFTSVRGGKTDLSGLLLPDRPLIGGDFDASALVSMAAMSGSVGEGGTGAAERGGQGGAEGGFRSAGINAGRGQSGATAPSGSGGSGGSGGEGGGEVQFGPLALNEAGSLVSPPFVTPPTAASVLNDGSAQAGSVTGRVLIGNGASSGTVMAMPLPASMWMLLGAIAGLGVLSYRRRKAWY